MPDAAFRVPVGLNGEFFPYILNAGKPVTTYSGTEPVRGRVWQGDDTAELDGFLIVSFDPALATMGKTRAAVDGDVTAALTPGWYRARCEIFLPVDQPFPDYRWFAYFDGSIELLDAPGAGLLPDTYCSLQDMLDLAGGWLPKLQNELGRTNFAAERARAKTYMDRVILAHSRPATGGGYGYSIADGYSASYGGGYGDYIAGLLSAGHLMKDAEWTRAAAYYSLHLACERANSWEPGDPYLMRARWALLKFNQIMFSYTASFDTNGDGSADVSVNLGVISIK